MPPGKPRFTRSIPQSVYRLFRQRKRVRENQEEQWTTLRMTRADVKLSGEKLFYSLPILGYFTAVDNPLRRERTAKKREFAARATFVGQRTTSPGTPLPAIVLQRKNPQALILYGKMFFSGWMASGWMR